MNEWPDWHYIAMILLSAINETRSCSEEEMWEDLKFRGLSDDMIDKMKNEYPVYQEYFERENRKLEKHFYTKMNPPGVY
jgi:hypothetical protein